MGMEFVWDRKKILEGECGYSYTRLQMYFNALDGTLKNSKMVNFMSCIVDFLF